MQGELWLIIRKKNCGQKGFAILKSTTEESHNVYCQTDMQKFIIVHFFLLMFSNLVIIALNFSIELKKVVLSLNQGKSNLISKYPLHGLCKVLFYVPCKFHVE